MEKQENIHVSGDTPIMFKYKYKSYLMKNLLILLLALSDLYVFGQSKKTVAKPVTQVKPILSKEDIIKIKAEDWFKTVYVEIAFKDPYSYKHLKTLVITKSRREWLIDSLAIIKNTIDTTKLTPKDVDDRAKFQSMYNDNIADIDKCSKLLETAKDPAFINYYEKKIALDRKYALLSLSILRKIDLYNIEVKQKDILEQIINELTPEQANQLAYYEIRIDCYSNNSIGNQVLGRFSFPINKDGSVIGSNGLNSVTQLNKE